MENSRQKILSYIIEQRRVTVEELSKVMRVTPANIRHHLSILIQQGSVKVIGQKPAGAKGRPAQIYAASQQTEQHNFDQLCAALLDTLAHIVDPGDQDRWLQILADFLSPESIPESTNPTRRLYAAIKALNSMNYQAHWEAHVVNPRIMLDHCPYRAIIDFHPELCRMDALFLGNLLTKPVRQIEKLAVDDRGIPQCIFLVNTFSG
jgi:predicted ArsR family transcriptional regulator